RSALVIASTAPAATLLGIHDAIPVIHIPAKVRQGLCKESRRRAKGRVVPRLLDAVALPFAVINNSDGIGLVGVHAALHVFVVAAQLGVLAPVGVLLSAFDVLAVLFNPAHIALEFAVQHGPGRCQLLFEEFLFLLVLLLLFLAEDYARRNLVLDS